jgi:hypothetical protein
LDETLLRGLGAVTVKEGLIASEKAVRRGFLVWGKLLRSLGRQGSWRRKPVLVVYILWLVLALIVIVPLSLLIRKLTGPFLQGRIARQKAYFGAPSGA